MPSAGARRPTRERGAGFGVRPYSTVGVSLRLMAFTITYQTTAVTITVKTNQISKLVMSSILPLAHGAMRLARVRGLPFPSEALRFTEIGRRQVLCN